MCVCVCVLVGKSGHTRQCVSQKTAWTVIHSLGTFYLLFVIRSLIGRQHHEVSQTNWAPSFQGSACLYAALSAALSYGVWISRLRSLHWKICEPKIQADCATLQPQGKRAVGLALAAVVRGGGSGSVANGGGSSFPF